MIDKFNFYDVYGYFLPGLALTAILWLPFGLVTGIWPRGDWGSAIMTVALSYFLGHLMLYISTKAIPSIDVQKSPPDKERSYAATLMDGNSHLSAELRHNIKSAVYEQFQLEMDVTDSTGKDDTHRDEAFSLARQRLILENVEGYAEQFQGMYSLSRGLVVAFSVGTAYYLGWILSVVGWKSFLVGAYLLVILCSWLMLDLSIRLWWEEYQKHKRTESRKELPQEEQRRLRATDRRRERERQQQFAGAVLLAFLGTGCVLGFSYNLEGKTCTYLALAAAVAPIAAIRCYTQYRSFAVHFAMTVWRDFMAYALSHPRNQNSRVQFE